MLKSKLIILIAISLSLVGCDQVRDKLVNGFNWNSNRVDSVNNNESIGGTELSKQIKQVTKAEDKPKQAATTSKQISGDSRPPISINPNPNDKPKLAPVIRPKDTNGFKDNDW